MATTPGKNIKYRKIAPKNKIAPVVRLGWFAPAYGILVVSKLLTEVLGHKLLGAIILWAMA